MRPDPTPPADGADLEQWRAYARRWERVAKRRRLVIADQLEQLAELRAERAHDRADADPTDEGASP
jgi:hypothetical protein